MDPVNLLYELPSGRIVSILVDIGNLDYTCDGDLVDGTELWTINHWEVDCGYDSLSSMDQYDLDHLDDLELLEMCVDDIGR